MNTFCCNGRLQPDFSKKTFIRKALWFRGDSCIFFFPPATESAVVTVCGSRKPLPAVFAELVHAALPPAPGDGVALLQAGPTRED